MEHDDGEQESTVILTAGFAMAHTNQSIIEYTNQLVDMNRPLHNYILIRSSIISSIPIPV